MVPVYASLLRVVYGASPRCLKEGKRGHVRCDRLPIPPLPSGEGPPLATDMLSCDVFVGASSVEYAAALEKTTGIGVVNS